MPRPAAPSLSEQLSGVIERIVCHSPETGYAVFRIRASGTASLLTVAGRMPIGSPGEYLTATGRWVNDYVHGWQFRADTIAILPPDTISGMAAYLKSGAVPGIGAVYAKKNDRAFR